MAKKSKSKNVPVVTGNPYPMPSWFKQMCNDSHTPSGDMDWDKLFKNIESPAYVGKIDKLVSGNDAAMAMAAAGIKIVVK
jgi:hypothetical protein